MSSRPLAMPSGALAVGNNTVWTGKATLNSVTLISDGTNAATVIVYDNTTNSGTILHKMAIPATTVPGQTVVFNNAVKCEIGLTVAVTGTGAVAYVTFNGA